MNSNLKFVMITREQMSSIIWFIKNGNLTDLMFETEKLELVKQNLLK